MPRQRINGGLIGPVNDFNNYIATGMWSLDDYRQGELSNWPLVDDIISTTDPFFNRTNLLIHADGSNGSNNNIFIDSSSSPFTITRNGNVTQSTFTPFTHTGWSLYFPGTADIGVKYTGSTSFAMGTGDFTIEMWFYPQTLTRTAGHTLYDSRPSLTNGAYITLRMTDGGGIDYIANSGSQISASNVFTLNKWHHVAVSRSGTSTRVFVDGVQKGSTYTDSTNYLAGSPGIGVDTYRNTDAILGPAFISNFRIVKGTALYTGSYTPPTAPLTNITNTTLLTLQDNRLVDNSSSPITPSSVGSGVFITAFSPFNTDTVFSTSTVGGSAYFDGTGDWLSATLTGATPGTGDFTYECWAYVTSLATARILWTTRSGNTSDGFQVFVDTGGELRVGYQGTNFINSAAAFIRPGIWFHVAVTRSGTTMTLWHNGTSVGTSQRSENFNSTTFRMGIQTDTSGSLMLGYISDMRVTIGTALYTGAFNVPTAPLTTSTNTKLLLNFTNAAVIDSTAKNSIETAGDASLSSTQAKFGSTSIYLDGTGDRLTIPDHPQLRFRTDDFTVECWAFPTGGAGTERGIISKGAASTGWSLIATSFDYWGFTTTSTTAVSNAKVELDKWTHLALVRSGSTITLYVNGALAGTATGISTDFSQTDPLYIGSGRTANVPFTGYIDEVRITLGVARYTSTFSPAKSAFFNL